MAVIAPLFAGPQEGRHPQGAPPDGQARRRRRERGGECTRQQRRRHAPGGGAVRLVEVVRYGPRRSLVRISSSLLKRVFPRGSERARDFATYRASVIRSLIRHPGRPAPGDHTCRGGTRTLHSPLAKLAGPALPLTAAPALVTACDTLVLTALFSNNDLLYSTSPRCN